MKIPIFPLSGAVMFPKTNLPLNIFEERYISMIDYSLSNNRFLGMVQQKSNNELYNIGCFGKITAFNETADKRYLINLEGINYFKIIKQLETDFKFLICEIEILDNFTDNCIDNNLKKKILDSFREYNKVKKINLSINEISDLNAIDLLKFIIMISPFEASVKQMFLELKSSKELYKNVLSTLEIETAIENKTTSIN